MVSSEQPLTRYRHDGHAREGRPATRFPARTKVAASAWSVSEKRFLLTRLIAETRQPARSLSSHLA
jgi:hypothetical protein